MVVVVVRGKLEQVPLLPVTEIVPVPVPEVAEIEEVPCPVKVPQPVPVTVHV
jgi:hypothetical protein